MTEKLEIYKCEICGNIVEVVHDGMGTLVCCGKPMILQEENSVDAAKEKHVPVLKEVKEGVEISVGSILHPMTEEHYIEWVEIQTENGNSRKYLSPGQEPKVFFPVKNKVLNVRAYCNLHGLWKN